jgi:two-component system, OmpR family, response regulator RpaA
MARIMIVDDDESILDVLNRALASREYSIVTARNGREAMELLQRHKPDLAILDIVMPHVNGVQVCRYMRMNPTLASIPILFLTAKERIEDKIAGFEAGADDYLTKPFDLNELKLRVKALLRHVPNVTPTGPLSAGAISIDPDKGHAQLDGRLLDLTPVEFELLYFMVSHADEVLSAERLLQEVWGYPPGTGNSSLVRMHVLNLRRKIEQDANHPLYVRTIPRHGYVIYSSSQR